MAPLTKRRKFLRVSEGAERLNARVDGGADMETINEEQIINAPQTITVLPRRKSQKFVAGDTTPSVKNHEHWEANNVVATTITQFDDGAECQSLFILGDNNTTIAHNANIKTNTGANKLLATNRLYHLVRINSVWYEE